MKNRALIYGYRRSAMTVKNYIETHFADTIEILGFYTDEMTDAEVAYTIEDIINDVVYVDMLIIPNQGKNIGSVMELHKKLHDKKILYVPADSIRIPKKENYFITLDGQRPWLNGFEFHAADHCNLNCKGCGHCSNLFRNESFPDIAEYKRDLKRLSELFEGVGLIRFLGGEPLLNPQLHKLIEVTKHYIPRCELHIVTNGLLLKQMPLHLLDNIRRHSVIIDISVYPPVSVFINEIIEFLSSMGIEYNIMPTEKFYKRFSLDGKYNINDAFTCCSTATCHTLYNGKIAPCIVPFSTEKLNEVYGLKIPIDGWIDIHKENITGQMINKQLLKPFELCSHCRPEKEFFEWEQRRLEECKLNDWVI